VAFDDLGLDAPALAFGHRPIGHEQRVVGACSIVWLDLGREPVTRPAVLLLLLDGAIFGYDTRLLRCQNGPLVSVDA
jgi:hypothetical protein